MAVKLIAPRDVRFHTDIMVGPKQIVPQANIENGKLGWTILVDRSPEGKPQPDRIWIGHPDYGWTEQHITGARYIRWWIEGDEKRADFPQALKAQKVA
jgi:hypothetical protein